MLCVREGNAKAFEELVRKNSAMIFSVAYRFLRDRELAEDIVQEVFLRVHRSRASYSPAAKFSTWIYRITANLSFNVIRSRKKKHAINAESLSTPDNEFSMQHLPDKTAPPSEGMSGDELKRKVSDALDSLPETQKIAIILNKFEGKNYTEIAQILDMTNPAVKSILSRARKKLYQKLHEYVKEDG